MKIGIGIGSADSGRTDPTAVIDFAVEAERIGVDVAWSAEAWGEDAVTSLSFLAARTERIQLGTGIMQISARVPSMTAMTALTLSRLSGGRFILGLGASGPQVVEGLQGQSFARPLTRMRETVEIVRKAFAGEKLEYHGREFQLPRPGGEGKALRLSQPANPDIPIYLATLGPKALEYTGAAADGWLGTSFIPEEAEAHLSYLRTGAKKAGRELSDLVIGVGAPVEFGDLGALIEKGKPGVAFSLGAMGSAKTNFYNEAYRRGGFEDAAIEVQKLWKAGKRQEAIQRVPDELVLKTSLIGDEKRIRERIRMYRDVGVGQMMLHARGDSAHERLDTLGRAIEIVREECP